jgi:hypothetical protein
VFLDYPASGISVTEMTMLLILATAGAVFIAADSRQYPVTIDTLQKVMLVGKDGIVAQGGIRSFDGSTSTMGGCVGV